jgi:hypothetical protein
MADLVLKTITDPAGTEIMLTEKIPTQRNPDRQF